MDVAAMSTMLSQSKVQQQASFSVMKMAMENAGHQMEDMTEMVEESVKAMEQSVSPHLGANIDIKL